MAGWRARGCRGQRCVQPGRAWRRAACPAGGGLPQILAVVREGGGGGDAWPRGRDQGGCPRADAPVRACHAACLHCLLRNMSTI